MLNFKFKTICSFSGEVILLASAYAKRNVGYQRVLEVYVLQTCNYLYTNLDTYTYKLSEKNEFELDEGNSERCLEQAKEFLEHPPKPLEQPVFPKAFLKHCPQVKANGGDESMAECAFNSAGGGMMCENCSLHLTRPFIRQEHEVDREFLPLIEEYYRDISAYEASINTLVP